MKISDQVLDQEVRGETVLLDLASENYFGLDSVGTRVWQLLGEGKQIVEIIDVLLVEYEVERGQLEADVNELVTHLLKTGLLTISRETA